MGRPAYPHPRTQVVMRFDDDVLAAIDALPGRSNRTARIHNLLRRALIIAEASGDTWETTVLNLDFDSS